MTRLQLLRRRLGLAPPGGAEPPASPLFLADGRSTPPQSSTWERLIHE